jgi:hypothetical protein
MLMFRVDVTNFSFQGGPPRPGYGQPSPGQAMGGGPPRMGMPGPPMHGQPPMQHGPYGGPKGPISGGMMQSRMSKGMNSFTVILIKLRFSSSIVIVWC